jgi:hypothetical protein
VRAQRACPGGGVPVPRGRHRRAFLRGHARPYRTGGVQSGYRGVVLDTASDGEVLDWPWLIPPHRWLFDARAVESTSVVSLESACLRGKRDADPRLGYELVQRVAQVMSDRLPATRVRLLDLHGSGNRAPGDRASEAAGEPSDHA